MRTFIKRFLTAWRIAGHVENPAYAVVYDVPELDAAGERTGDIVETYYEAFDSPKFAMEMFRDAYPEDMDNPPENARLVLILDRIDGYAEPY